MPAAIPKPVVTDVLKRVIADPQFVVLKPGVTATIDTGGSGDCDRGETVRSAMVAKITANGEPALSSSHVTTAGLR